MNSEYDLIIVGGGSAGLASAISAYDNGIKSILLMDKEVSVYVSINKTLFCLWEYSKRFPKFFSFKFKKYQ